MQFEGCVGICGHCEQNRNRRGSRVATIRLSGSREIAGPRPRPEPLPVPFGTTWVHSGAAKNVRPLHPQRSSISSTSAEGGTPCERPHTGTPGPNTDSRIDEYARTERDRIAKASELRSAFGIAQHGLAPCHLIDEHVPVLGEPARQSVRSQ